MKIKILKTELTKNIQNVQNIVSSKSSLPILSNILIETDKNSVKMVGTDLDVGMITNFGAEIEESGSITIPAKRFSDIVKELPEEDVYISTMKNNSVMIKCGKCFFKILGLPKEDFPKLPDFEKDPHVVIEQSTLKNMLSLSCFSMSHDETRYVLNGALCLFKSGKIIIVTTDGKRLSLVKKDIGKEVSNKVIIVPSKTVYELTRILQDEGEVKITFGENQVRFEIDNIKIISRLIEGEFPNFEQVIPKEAKEKIIVKREDFLLGTRRAALLTSQDSQAIKIDILKNKMVVSKSNPNIGEAREEIDVAYKGPELSAGFNPTYLLDVLKVIPKDELGLEITAADKPAVIRIEDWYIYLVLPMQTA